MIDPNKKMPRVYTRAYRVGLTTEENIAEYDNKETGGVIGFIGGIKVPVNFPNKVAEETILAACVASGWYIDVEKDEDGNFVRDILWKDLFRVDTVGEDTYLYLAMRYSPTNFKGLPEAVWRAIGDVYTKVDNFILRDEYWALIRSAEEVEA